MSPATSFRSPYSSGSAPASASPDILLEVSGRVYGPAVVLFVFESMPDQCDLGALARYSPPGLLRLAAWADGARQQCRQGQEAGLRRLQQETPQRLQVTFPEDNDPVLVLCFFEMSQFEDARENGGSDRAITKSRSPNPCLAADLTD